MPGRWITLAELESRSAEWRELVLSSEFPTAYSDPGWVLAWWRHYGDAHEPWSFALEAPDGTLGALALLARRRSRLARRLVFAGGGWNGLEGLVCMRGAEEECVAALTQALYERRREWDLWRIQRLPRASALWRGLTSGGEPLGAAAHDLRMQPYLELPASTEDFEARFGSKQRNTQRRKRKRLDELGARPRLMADTEQAAAGLEIVLEQRRQRALSQGQRHRHMDARFRRFLFSAVRELTPARARVWLLELDGQVLASRLNLVAGPREHSYLLGMGEGHANLSPGSHLELHVIEEAIREGRTELELGPGRQEYKYRLGARDRELGRLVIASRSLRGRGVGSVSAADLRLRNSSAADVLRRRRGLTPARGGSLAAADASRPR